MNDIKKIDVYKNLPKRVRIGSIWIKVIVGEHDDHEIEGSFGHFNQLKSVISLRPNMNSQQLANTFIHECIHAMNSISRAGVGLTDHYDIEEDYTSKVAHGISQFWQDNPSAVMWWMAATHLDTEAK